MHLITPHRNEFDLFGLGGVSHKCILTITLLLEISKSYMGLASACKKRYTFVMANFTNQVVLVTGGSSGIGRATCLAFAREGAKVVVSDVSEPGGQETVTQIRAKGGEAIFVRADVSKAADVESLINKTLATYQGLDCAFNNAGIAGSPTALANSTEEEWDRILDINLKGVFLCMKYELAHMVKHKRGVLVNCASVAGLVGFASAGAYTASKHGIVGLTKAAALEYATLGIRINAVCPGVIRTPMIESYTQGQPTMEAQLISGEPIHRMGTPEEIAEAVLWLCSKNASFVTGHALAVDGGWVAQ